MKILDIFITIKDMHVNFSEMILEYLGILAPTVHENK